MQAIQHSVKCRTKLNGMLMACVEAATDWQHFLAVLGEHGTRLQLAVLISQSCLTLCDPTDCSRPGSSVHGILQARILQWVAIPFSRGSFQPTNPSLYIAGRFFTIWATREAVLHGHLAASQKLSMNALWPSISTSRVLSHINWYLKNLHNCTDARTGTYVAALFATVRSWKLTAIDGGAPQVMMVHPLNEDAAMGQFRVRKLCQVRKRVSWLDEKNKWYRTCKACPEF